MQASATCHPTTRRISSNSGSNQRSHGAEASCLHTPGWPRSFCTRLTPCCRSCRRRLSGFPYETQPQCVFVAENPSPIMDLCTSHHQVNLLSVCLHVIPNYVLPRPGWARLLRRTSHRQATRRRPRLQISSNQHGSQILPATSAISELLLH